MHLCDNLKLNFEFSQHDDSFFSLCPPPPPRKKKKAIKKFISQQPLSLLFLIKIRTLLFTVQDTMCFPRSGHCYGNIGPSAAPQRGNQHPGQQLTDSGEKLERRL